MPGDIPPSIRAHMSAVEQSDPAAMAADYTHDAVMERPGARIEGHAAIAEYFLGVPQRLAGGAVRFQSVDMHADGTVTFQWRIEGGPGHGSSGCDTVQLRNGLIAHQQVQLHAQDF